MELIKDPEVDKVFDNYPKIMRSKMMRLRKFILEVAASTDGIEQFGRNIKMG